MADAADTGARDTTVRVARDTADILVAVSRAHGETVSEYIDRALRPIVLREHLAILEEQRTRAKRELAAAK